MHGRPVVPKRPTLGNFDCLLKLCPALAKACHLAPEVLAKYLDPYYCPPSRFGHRPLDPIAYRVVGVQGRVGTIMARYHQQHNLPEPSMVRGGILGNLFKDRNGLRFLAGAEIALIHCCHQPFFMPQDDTELMTIIGNSLSLPHAAIPLAFAVSCLQKEGKRVEPHEAVLWTLKDRTRASAAVIIPLRDGWVLCHRDQVPSAMQRLRPSVPWGPLPCTSALSMSLVWLKDEADEFPIVWPSAIALPHVLDSIGLQYDEHALAEVSHALVSQPISPAQLKASQAAQTNAVLEVPSILEIRCSVPALQHDPCTGPRLLLIHGVQAVYVVAHEGPQSLRQCIM